MDACGRSRRPPRLQAPVHEVEGGEPAGVQGHREERGRKQRTLALDRSRDNRATVLRAE